MASSIDFRAAAFAWLFFACGGWTGTALAAGGKLELTVVDAETGQPIACRIHLKNMAGRPQQPPQLPFYHDHFTCPGQVVLKLPRGNYTFEVEHGPEAVFRTGYFTINDFADDQKQIDLKRFVDMAAEHWYAGDLDVERPAVDAELLLQAETVHVACQVTWWNGKSEWKIKTPPAVVPVELKSGRFWHPLAGRDQRPSGTLLLLNLAAPRELPDTKTPLPSPAELAAQATQLPHGWIDVTADSWDLPLLLSQGWVRSIALADGRLNRGAGLVEMEPIGRPATSPASRASTSSSKNAGLSIAGYLPAGQRLEGPQALGRWWQTIYYHVLNSGFRVPPSANSGSGRSGNPLGYNRVYVFVGDEFTYDNWWAGLAAGRAVVTNGPLIRPIVAGKLPGHLFQLPQSGPLVCDAVLNLALREKATYLEVVTNGRVSHSFRIEELAARGGTLPALEFAESGWFVIRVAVDNDRNYRFATTAPFYLESYGQARRISRQSVEFFLSWAQQRLAQVEKTTDAADRHALVVQHQRAVQFWSERLSQATAP